jgi:hypothetical protein
MSYFNIIAGIFGLFGILLTIGSTTSVFSGTITKYYRFVDRIKSYIVKKYVDIYIMIMARFAPMKLCNIIKSKSADNVSIILSINNDITIGFNVSNHFKDKINGYIKEYVRHYVSKIYFAKNSKIRDYYINPFYAESKYFSSVENKLQVELGLNMYCTPFLTLVNDINICLENKTISDICGIRYPITLWTKSSCNSIALDHYTKFTEFISWLSYLSTSFENRPVAVSKKPCKTLYSEKAITNVFRLNDARVKQLNTPIFG